MDRLPTVEAQRIARRLNDTREYRSTACERLHADRIALRDVETGETLVEMWYDAEDME
jgi:hypothetical protein